MKMFDLKRTVLGLSKPDINSLVNPIEMYRGKTLSVQKLKKLEKLQALLIEVALLLLVHWAMFLFPKFKKRNFLRKTKFLSPFKNMW